MTRPLPPLVSERLTDGRAGVTSVCTAHPIVIEAALSLGLRTGRRVLIEATCNQVNQEGGYTGMTPADFRRFVETIASRVGLHPSRIILGGDHLGPNPWRHLPADEAMQRAKAMIEAYARAGFTKLHLDTSMGCAGEPAALADEVTAERAAALAKVAEGAAGTALAPVYIIGTEVPVPGGAQHALEFSRGDATGSGASDSRGSPKRRSAMLALRRPSRGRLAWWCNRASSSPAPKSFPTSPRRRSASRELWRACRALSLKRTRRTISRRLALTRWSGTGSRSSRWAHG